MIAATRAQTWRVSTREAGATSWATPPALYAALDQEFSFTLDAAADPGNAKHVRFVTLDTDALGLSWSGERVFCNPPYGRGLTAWLRKALHEATEGATVVMVLPARTDVSWFHEIVLPHAEVRFIRGRLGYTLGGSSKKGRAPFASMVVVFRPGRRWAGTGSAQVLMPFLEKVPT